MKKFSTLLVAFLCGLTCMQAQENNLTVQNYYESALEALNVGNNLYAVQQLTEGLHKYPVSADLYAVRAAVIADQLNYHLHKNNYQTAGNDTIARLAQLAVSDVNSAYQLWDKEANTTLAQILYVRGNIYSSLGAYDKAFDDYNLAYKHKRNDMPLVTIDILKARAALYKAVGALTNYQLDLSEVITICKKNIKKDPTEKTFYTIRLQTQYDLGFYNLVIEAAIEMLEKFPPQQYEDVDAYEDVLKLDPAYTQKMVAKKLKKDPDNATWLYLQALGSFHAGDYKTTLNQNQVLIEKFGSDYRLDHCKFICYHNLWCYDKGMALLEKMEQTYGKLDVNDVFYKMQLHSQKGEQKQVVAITTQLLDSLGYNSDIMLARAQAYRAMGEDAQAMIDLNEVIAKDAQNIGAYDKRSRIHRKYGATELEKADLDMVLQLDTVCSSGSIRHYALYFVGKSDEAIQWVDAIVAQAPHRGSRHYDRACLMSLMGKMDEALKSLEAALKAGYRAFDHMMHDTDIANLRKMPEFMPLIEHYKQEQDAMCAALIEP